jgi:hypothetical protein
VPAADAARAVAYSPEIWMEMPILGKDVQQAKTATNS